MGIEHMETMCTINGDKAWGGARMPHATLWHLNYMIQIIRDVQCILHQTFMSLLQAVDADSGSNGNLTFSLESSVENLFTLLETGPFSVQVLLNHMLDRENTDSYSFRVFATDGGSPALVGETVININVLVSYTESDNFQGCDMPARIRVLS